MAPLQLPSDDELRARFWELRAQKDALIAQAAPSRTAYHVLREREQDIQVEQTKVAAVFKKIEAPFVEIDTEMATIVRLLKGKTGEQPTR